MSDHKQKEQSIQEPNYYFSAFPLYEHKTPIFKENRRTEIIDYGQDNNYPDYLKYLFNRSALHGAIVRGKCNYVFGNGWQIKEGYNTLIRAEADRFMKSVNQLQTLDELTKDIISNWLITGAYALRITKVMGKIISVKNVPIDTLRTTEYCDKFYLSNEWTNDMTLDPKKRIQRGKLSDDVEIIPKYNQLEKNGDSIMYFPDANLGAKVYALPEYVAAIAAIELSIEIANFDINNVKSGFSAGTMLVMRGGIPTSQDEKDALERDIKGKLFGSDNAGEAVILHQMQDVEKPELLNMRSESIADQFNNLEPRCLQNILSGHGVSSGMIFGIKESGQLGGRNELQTAWELFYNTYVRPKQIELEKTINYLAELMGLPPVFELTQLEPIGLGLDINHVKEALSPDEFSEYVKDKLGIKTKEKQSFSAQKSKLEQRFLNEIGESADNFEVIIEGEFYNFAQIVGLKGDNLKVYEILQNKPRLTLPRLAEISKLSQGKVMQILEVLQKNNYINSTYRESNGIISVQVIPLVEETEPDVKLETRWKYDGVKDDRNRDFCAKMLKENKFYTRFEIDNLTNDMEDFTDDVWAYRGGWYHNPAGINQPYCRHAWKNYLVKRK
jgi:DNA-binding MarR family transcriptional regulator